MCRHHVGEHRLTMTEANAISSAAEMMRTVDESKAVSARHGPMVVIAGSGMATGGRIVHHLKAFAPDSRNTIALVGYQAAGTCGTALAAHRPAVQTFIPARQWRCPTLKWLIQINRPAIPK